MIDYRIALLLLVLTLASCVEELPLETEPASSIEQVTPESEERPSETEQRTPETGHTIAYELEDAKVEHAFVVSADTAASGGVYLTQPSSIPNSADASVSATIDLVLPEADTYVLWARMYGPSGAEDAAYLGMNTELNRVYPDEPGRYEWVRAGSWELDAGNHALSIGYAESGARLDLAIITNEEPSADELDRFITAPNDPLCGNGIVEAEEECDNGANNEPCSDAGCSYCATDCTIRTVAGVGTERSFSLRADPDFSLEELTPQARIWHERLIRGFDSQDPSYSTGPAGSDSLYSMGRQAHTHIQSLLWALRATGDARILDEVDDLAERMRATLSDSWCAPEPDHHYGYIGSDGYDNWRYKGDHSVHHCRDTIKLDESKTHGMIAMIAYAYEVNRDIESPSGIDYGERADFWKDYLFNHYEKKWQSRFDRDDALTRVEGFDSGHAQMSNAKMHYYLSKLSGDDTYLDRSIALSAPVLESMRVSPTDAGDAYVWSRRWRTSAEEDGFNLQATTYARYVFADFAELHIEGVEPWDDVDMTRFANTFTQYVMDDGSSSFARDIGGEQERAGIPPMPEGERTRFNAKRYAISPYVMILPWDETGKGQRITEEVYTSVESDPENPEHLYIPAAMVFYHEWRSDR